MPVTKTHTSGQPSVDNIISWLDEVPAGPEEHLRTASTVPSSLGKRKRPVLTPPASSRSATRAAPGDMDVNGDHISDEPNQRRGCPSSANNESRAEDDAYPRDPTQRTPRASTTFPRLDRTPTASSSTSRSETSGRSSSSRSPTKRKRALEVADNASLVLQINRNDPRMPQALKDELVHLDRFNRGLGVIPSYLRDELEGQRDNDRDETLFNISDTTFASEQTPTAFSTLSTQAMRKILDNARECFDQDHAETSWNMMVHWPIFELALGASPSHNPGVGAMPCTTARLSGDARGTKMVDFCIFIEPSLDDARRIDKLRAARPDQNINHTDYNPLRARPIVLSAESKKHGERLADAHLQIVVWQDRQWRLLESSGPAQQRPDTMVPFLPSLIIQGHDWMFTATTRQEGTTILWTKQPIGSTDNPLGIFMILCALRHIARWATTTYRPWYRQHILRLDNLNDAE